MVSADSEKNPNFNLKPILFLEINLGEGKFEKISVYEDTNELAEDFSKKHSSYSNLLYLMNFFISIDFSQNLLEKLKHRFSFEIEKKKKQLIQIKI